MCPVGAFARPEVDNASKGRDIRHRIEHARRKRVNVRTDQVRHTLDFFGDLDLLRPEDARQILWLFAPDFPFRAQLEAADSIHAHVKIADTALLARDAILNAGGRPESDQAGYVKYVFTCGINMIFSSIPVAEDDHLPDAAGVSRPFLDHAGIDIRRTTGDARRRFDAVTDTALRAGWRHVAQGGPGRAVHCCHTEIGEKHWAFPPTVLRSWSRPLEFAFGPLVIHAGKIGCDLRPIDPAHPRAGEAACCSPDDPPAKTCCAATGCDAPAQDERRTQRAVA